MMSRLTEGSDDPLGGVTAESVLLKIYFYLFAVRKKRGVDATTPDQQLSLDVSDPLPALGNYLSILNSGVEKTYTSDELFSNGGLQPHGWQTDLFHQALIFLAVRYQHHKRPDIAGVQRTRASLDVLQNWIEDLKPYNAKLAGVVKESLRGLVKGDSPDRW